MFKDPKKAIKFIIDDCKEKIKSNNPKIALKNNPNLLKEYQHSHKVEIDQLLKKIRDQHKELLPFVREIKKQINDITETTYICAVYLLLCHSFQVFNSLFILAEHGKHSSILTLIRMIKESLMLTNLFVIDSAKNHRKNIDKWFSGEIITHGVGRKETSKYHDELSLDPNIDLEKLEKFIYQIESLSVHISYASIVTCICPFNEDYEFAGATCLNYTKENLKHASLTMTATNITLMGVYSSLLKDIAGHAKLDKILLKYDPNINKKKKT